jgi:glycosyltransferase involved in cell wall biosynthesis
MATPFDVDPYPGKPKILFVGYAVSTHTHAWIDLLDESELNVRLFALPSAPNLPPENWKVRTYVTDYTSLKLDPHTRVSLYLPPLVSQVERLFQKRYIRRLRLYFHIRPLYRRRFVRHLLGGIRGPEEWLAKVIRQWRPDIIHTLGLNPAGHFYFRVRNRFKLAGIGKWVLQLRGGSDLTLTRLDPDEAPRIAQVLRECDQLLSNNEQDFSFASEMGVREEQISTLGTVPGTGGIDVASLMRSWHGPPSSRRIILWPRAYESRLPVGVKALPVFEAIKMSWDQIQPCEIYMLSMYPNNESVLWYRTLPDEIKRSCHAEYRIPRDKTLELMAQARVMLTPSLIDGTPNTMWEAMAAGALPIVSPLETIRPVVEHERNVLFARNLYPHEIAEALSRAMTDDALVDEAAERNLEVVRRRADRSEIGPRVVAYYEGLAKEQARSDHRL